MHNQKKNKILFEILLRKNIIIPIIIGGSQGAQIFDKILHESIIKVSSQSNQ